MKTICGVSLEGVPEHHLPQFNVYLNKPETPTRKKEVQSSKKFYTEFTNTQNLAIEWKNENAKDANVSCLLATIRSLEKYTGLKLHRICKTAYPLFVWMSHYPQIFDYLTTFKCFVIGDVQPLASRGNPFIEARESMKGQDYNSTFLTQAADELARKLIRLGHKISFITSVLLQDGTVLFTAVIKKANLGLNEFSFKQETEEIPKTRILLPSIQATFPGIRDFDLNSIITVDKGILVPFF